MTHQPRVLAHSESVSAPSRNTMRASVNCTGPLDLALLRRAWEMVGREAPSLAGTLRVSGGDYVFHPEPERAGIVRYVEGGPGDFQLTAHRTLDELNYVSAMEVYSLGRDRHVVSLLARHSIADGRRFVHAMSRLWELYTAMVEGVPEPALRKPILGGPLETVLKDRKIPGGVLREQGPSAPPVYLTGKDWDGRHLSGLHHGTVRLDAENTRLLRHRCRAQRISRHGVLAAAVIMSLSQSRADLTSFDLTSVIDIRPYVDPPIHPLSSTSALGYSTSHVDMRIHPDLGSIAKLIMENLRADLQSGFAQVSSILNSDLQSIGAVPTMLSNLGIVRTFSHPDNLAITDLSGWNEMDLDTPGSPDVLAIYGNMITASTYDGQLRVDLFHGYEMFPCGWTAAQVRQIEHILTAYAAAAQDLPRQPAVSST
jgi:phenolphthiocerol/phthiocerol/phthiodiolone dimycocerosyl transferase